MVFACLLAQADPAALVERLRSDDIEERERAEAEIVRLGRGAEAALDAVARDPDPEVASRARALLLDVVAPHRREVAREVEHLTLHAFRARDAETQLTLARALRQIDPAHPFSWMKAWGVEARRHLLDGLRYPDAAAWAECRDRVRAQIAKNHLPSCGVCVLRRLREYQVQVTFENARVEDILSHIETLGDLRIVVGGEASFDHAVTVDARGPLGEVLDRVLAQAGLESRVLEGGTVLAVRRKPAAE